MVQNVCQIAAAQLRLGHQRITARPVVACVAAVKIVVIVHCLGLVLFQDFTAVATNAVFGGRYQLAHVVAVINLSHRALVVALSPAANTRGDFKTCRSACKIAVFDDTAVMDTAGYTADRQIVITAGDGNIRGAPTVFYQSLVDNTGQTAGAPAILAAGCGEGSAYDTQISKHAGRG